MELQETSSDALNESMWLDQPQSPSYQQLSPSVQQNGRNVIATQQISVGYQVPDASILWNEKHESPRHSPDTNHHSLLHDETRGNSQPTQQASTSGYHQCTSSRKRPWQLNQIHDLDRKYARRDGPTGNNVSLQAWSSRQMDELAQHLVADLDGPLSAITTNELVNAVASYNMSEALLGLPSLTVFKQEAPSPENQINNSNLNHVSQRNINGPYQSNGNIGLLVEPDSNNSGNNIASNVSTTTTTITTTTITPNNTGNRNYSNHNNNIAPGFNSCNGNNGREQVTNFYSLLYSNKEDYSNSPSSGNHVSSSQQEYEFNGDNRFQYVLGAATSMAIKLNEETLTYLNQGQSYELKLKKLGDLSAYRGRVLKSSIKICFHERRLQYTEREQILAWQKARPDERLLEVDVPLSYGMSAVTQSSLPINTVEITWDPTKEANVYIKINCISTEFTAKKHGGEKGVPFRIQVETTLCNDFRLHAASCQIKVFKLKGADRKHKQDREKIRRKSSEKQESYQPSCECTVLSEMPLNLLPPTNSGFNNQLNSTDQNNTTRTQSLRNADGASPSGSGRDNISEGSPQHVPRAPSPALIPPNLTPINDTTVSRQYQFPENATPMHTAAWLRANGFQTLEATFKDYFPYDLRSLSRNDLIQMCGLARGIQLYNRMNLQAQPILTLYFSMETDGVNVWKTIYLHNLTIEALTKKIIEKFNFSHERLHSIWFRGPHNRKIAMYTDDVEHMKDESFYLIEIIKDSSNDNKYQLLLKLFNSENDV